MWQRACSRLSLYTGQFLTQLRNALQHRIVASPAGTINITSGNIKRRVSATRASWMRRQRSGYVVVVVHCWYGTTKWLTCHARRSADVCHSTASNRALNVVNPLICSHTTCDCDEMRWDRTKWNKNKIKQLKTVAVDSVYLSQTSK